MWILPRIVSLADMVFFSTLEHYTFVYLMENTKTLLGNVISSVLIQNMRYRIVCHRRGESWVIAVSDSLEVIKDHWNYLKTDVLLSIGTLDDVNDQQDFLLNKIKGLAAIEEGEEGKDERRLQSFRQDFPELKKEQYVTYATGLWWEKSWYVPFQGVLYFTSDSTSFIHEGKKEYRKILSYNLISQLSKDSMLGINNAIKIVYDQQEFWFQTLNGRDQLFEIMDNLWHNSISIWKERLDPEGMGKAPNKVFTNSPGQKNQSISIAEMSEKKRHRQFCTKFRVPDFPNYDNTYMCTFRYNGYLRPGTLYLTDNFCCFESSAKFPDPIKLVIAWINVTLVEGQDFLLGLVRHSFRIVTASNSHYFAVNNRDHVLKKMEEFVKQSLSYKKKKFIPADQTNDAWMLDQERINDQEYVFDETVKLNHWGGYFDSYGVLPDPVISHQFETYVRQGVPDIYRGQVWQLLSGSMHKMEANVGYYWALKGKEDSSVKGEHIARDEIDKDLKRTFPTNPYFQGEEAITRLRDVLVTYSKRAPHIGYAQSMNFLVGNALLYMSEEEAFWLLVTICEDIVPEHYTKGLQLLGSIVDQQIFSNLVEKYFPKIFEHIKTLAIPLETLTFPWFLCFFIGYVPWTLSLHILDLVFLLGVNVLFQIGLAIIAIVEPDIMEVDILEPHKLTSLFRTSDNKKLSHKKVIEIAFTRFLHLPLDEMENWKKKKKFGIMNNLQADQDDKSFSNYLKTYPYLKKKDIKDMHRRFVVLANQKTISKKEYSDDDKVIDSQQFQELIVSYIPTLAGESGDTVIMALWTAGDRPDLNVMRFEGFLDILCPLKGSVLIQFKFIRSLLFPRIASLNRNEMKLIFDILYRISYDGPVPYEANWIKITKFIGTFFEGLPENEVLPDDQLNKIIDEEKTLENFWTTLYF